MIVHDELDIECVTTLQHDHEIADIEIPVVEPDERLIVNMEDTEDELKSNDSLGKIIFHEEHL
jgi:hypothetical protein